VEKLPTTVANGSGVQLLSNQLPLNTTTGTAYGVSTGVITATGTSVSVSTGERVGLLIGTAPAGIVGAMATITLQRTAP
jgi:hypothetical protein